MICIISCGSNKVGDIERNLTELGVESDIVAMDDTQTIDFEKYSGVIISGSPILVTDPGMDIHLQKFTFLERYPRPVFGICFGHQVLCLLSGAEGFIGEEVKRDEMITVVESGEILKGIPSGALFAQNHREYMSVPKQFTLLAYSDSCPVEAVQHQQKKWYGVQFHPEVSVEAGKQLFRNFAAVCGEAIL
jgi:GMP synthase (glutamine-hydrolysing)